MRQWERLGGAAFFSAFMMACSVEPDAPNDQPDEPLGQAQEQFTGYLNFDVINGSTTDWVSVGTQGFLNGLGGNLAKPGSTTPEGRAVVHQAGGGFHQLTVFATPGSGSNSIRANGWGLYPGDFYAVQTSCSHSGAGSQTVALTEPTGTYKCFIMQIQNNNGNSFSAWGDEVKITYSGGQASLTCSNNSEATAACMNITHDLGSWSAGWSGGNTTTDLGAVDWTNGKVCLFYGLWGNFRSNSTTDWAWVDVDTAPSPDKWRLRTTINKGAWVNCVD